MSKKLKIGIDVDGILADFNSSYRELVHQYSDVRLPEISNTYPTSWNYPRDAGLDKATDNKLWEVISKSNSFWQDLPAYPDTKNFLEWAGWLPTEVDVYFITSRPGWTAKHQTENWLRFNGFGATPTVLISSEKGQCAEALKLTHYIDDKNENCTDVFNGSGSITDVYMLVRPWNHEQKFIPRIASLTDFKKVIEDAIL